jgi:hypothetical protein
MRQLAQQCVSGLRHPLVAGGIGMLLGLGLGLLVPNFGVVVSLGPLLAILLCLAPCLVPLVLLRRSGGRTPQPPQDRPLAGFATERPEGHPLP